MRPRAGPRPSAGYGIGGGMMILSLLGVAVSFAIGLNERRVPGRRV